MVGGPRQYHLAALRRGEWPTPWIWEIFHRGKPLEVRLWGGYFKTYNAAMRAGRPTFDEFLASCPKGKMKVRRRLGKIEAKTFVSFRGSEARLCAHKLSGRGY
jgi:hypothetical protein